MAGAIVHAVVLLELLKEVPRWFILVQTGNLVLVPTTASADLANTAQILQLILPNPLRSAPGAVLPQNAFGQKLPVKVVL